MKKLFLITLTCTLLFSCGEDDVDCTSIIPEPSNLILKFEDTAGNSLIGTTFVQDSFKLSNANLTTYVGPNPFGPQDELVIWLSSIASGETYHLELSTTDSDTLSVSFTEINGDCFSRLRTDAFTYNNEVLYDGTGTNDDYFVIIKE